MPDEDGSPEETGKSAAAEAAGVSHDLGDLWQQYFGFESPYENQAAAIESALQIGRANGYLAMEGPCGTGKTMAALTAAATLVRETDQYDNVLVVTPVKQQLRQFVDDLRGMNATLDDSDGPAPLSGIALVGKRDLCPYGREGIFPQDRSTHERCEDLRESTASLVEARDDGDPEPVASTAVGGTHEDIWWDPRRASELARHARPSAAHQRSLGEQALQTAGVESPYRGEQPSAPSDMTSDDGETLYCPFEADWYARNRGSPIDFSVGQNHVVTSDEYLPAATERGTCPHRVMSVLLGSADVVIGNYNHLFDPDSRPLLAEALGERTFVIVDEAHRLEERVRDLLSQRVGRSTLKRARNDCAAVLSRADKSAAHDEQVRDILASRDVPIEAVRQARTFFEALQEWMDDRIAVELDDRVGDAWRFGETETLPDQTIEIPLRDPETVETDDLTVWAEEAGYGGDTWRTLSHVGGAVEAVIDEVGPDRQPVVPAVGAILQQWWEHDHATYLREIELEPTARDARRIDEPWQARYTAGLVLFECMPGDALRNVLGELGGGVLMSATLEPLDVFSEVAGLEALRQADRPVLERSYTLPFPAANRASWIVDATPFTASNRGDPAEHDNPETWNQTRDEYAHVLRSIARSNGNIMIAMPNYREAQWAGEYLEKVVDKPVLVDESSANEVTDELRDRFVAGDGKVLVTSARGTLTEGVDYAGDKLHCCAVVGVPLVNIGSPRITAVRRAYADAFGESNAFEYALTVPAVRRARQAIGRVIRGFDEVGVRLFVGQRYVEGARHSVFPYLSAEEREEFVRMTPEFLSRKLEDFWASR